MIVVHELAHLKEKEITKRFTSCAAIWSRSTTSLSRHPAVANAVVAWAGQNLKMSQALSFLSLAPKIDLPPFVKITTMQPRLLLRICFSRRTLKLAVCCCL